ncbi:MAG TPA: HAMP domain-containing histidine kinase [Candidatus Gemmiger avistercoris]|uniref:histidine kinase n=1 Tax=Candidatus Gemmiger avistercoris TaxID=2838606 RepID=A0A9D2FHZ2_9FIRM|nr:HAMP domain-containing sensor histidine kinase [uncultured Subdoligranulum sp.]HIZ61609.1 HAMP domain-containing histidine kinase [Candidatus Gemmiger avistercoris]
MELVAFVFAFSAAAAALAACAALHRTRQKLAEIERAVADIRSGNGCRRILARPGEPAAALVYEINDIVQNYEGRLAALQTAQEANRQLMTSLSHDVRTPLTTLIGALDAAHRGLLTGQAREESLDAARRKAHELKNYVDALFDWFKLNSGEFSLQPRPVEAVELTRNFLADWVPLWEEQGMNYRLQIPEGPFRAALDPDAYRRILNNLLQNALTHSRAQCTSVTLTARDGALEVQVADDGVGIPAEALPHIFERLYKGDASRGSRGSGLGLSIARQLALCMGGSLTAASTPGKGAVFTLQFPLLAD